LLIEKISRPRIGHASCNHEADYAEKSQQAEGIPGALRATIKPIREPLFGA
jgi:hypothetical protein